MTDLIHSTSDNGLGLIYLKDRGVAGIATKALARLLDCNYVSISGAIARGASQEYVLKTEIPTNGGVQGANFILEAGVIQVLKYIRKGKFKPETKAAAEDLYDRFALAGFKLYTILQVAPEELRSMLTPNEAVTTISPNALKRMEAMKPSYPLQRPSPHTSDRQPV